ncbi:MAG: CotH kinase family protein [Patescibacteria group bacterium]
MKSKLVKLIVSLLIICLFWFGYKTSLGYAQYLPQPYRQWFGLAHFKLQTAVANLVDAFYLPTYWHKYSARKLTAFNLIMSPADITKLKEDAQQSVALGYNAKQSASTQQISLLYADKPYSASISFHGGGAADYVFNKNDYNIKINDKQSVAGYEAFNLFNPSVHNWLVPLLANQVASKLQLYYNDQFPVLVKMNNKTSGVYLLEEKINDDFFAKRGLNSAQVIKQRDETRLPHRINTLALNAHILSGWDFEIANTDPFNQDNPTILYRLDQFYKAIQARDFKQISQFIDLDYWARYDAFRELLAIDHDTSGANFIMFYLSQDQKFYPVARSEGDLNPLAVSNGNTLASFNNYDPHLAEQFDYPRIFLLLNLAPQFRILKYHYLNQLVNKSAELNQAFQSVYEQYESVFLYDTSDEASVWEKQRRFNGYLQTISANLNLIKQELTFAQVAINVVNQKNIATIEIIPDSLMPVQFDLFELEFGQGQAEDVAKIINQKIIMATINQQLAVIPTTFTFSFPVKQPVTSLKLKAKNQITGFPIDKIFTAIASE